MTTAGRVLHGAARCDLLIWLITLGRERAFREKLLTPAGLQAGESVLDVGCGTGSLAIAAKRHGTAPASAPAFGHEIRRVLNPGGRVLAVDFGKGEKQTGRRDSPLSPPCSRRPARHHGVVDRRRPDAVDSGAVGMLNLQFVLAARPFAPDADDCDRARPPIS